MVALGSVLLLAGCFGGGEEIGPSDSDDSDQEGEGGPGDSGEDQEGDPDADEEPGSPWTQIVKHSGQVATHLCTDRDTGPWFCVEMTQRDDTLSLSFDNASVTDVEAVVSWNEEWSVEDRVLTLSCDDSEGGDCNGLEPVSETGGSPLSLSVDDYGLPRNTTMNLTVTIHDPYPEAIEVAQDGEHDFELEATLRLDPTL